VSTPDNHVDRPDADRPGRPPALPGGPAERLRKIGIAAVVIAIVVAVVAWIDAKRELSALRLEVAARLSSADAAEAQAKVRDAAMAGEMREALAKLALVETRLAESQSQQAALETLYRDLAPSRDDLAVVEVEQVLSLASQQLAIAGNVPAAIAALQLADGKLARLDRPKFAPLRRAIASDMEKLKAVPTSTRRASRADSMPRSSRSTRCRSPATSTCRRPHRRHRSPTRRPGRARCASCGPT